MKIVKKLTALATAFGIGVLANSYNIETTEGFRFNNPIPIGSTLEEQIDLISSRPYMIDTTHSIDLFNFTIPLKTIRTVIYPSSGENYSGELDEEGNIHTPRGIYELQNAHDSNWYKLAKK